MKPLEGIIITIDTFRFHSRNSSSSDSQIHGIQIVSVIWVSPNFVKFATTSLITFAILLSNYRSDCLA
ncbi:MAG: hypothetical protein ACRD47_16120, partial [Nitrososphaeraceae archaeon]